MIFNTLVQLKIQIINMYSVNFLLWHIYEFRPFVSSIDNWVFVIEFDSINMNTIFSNFHFQNSTNSIDSRDFN